MTALFDFDGVVMDTEELYTVFWDRMGEKYLGVKNLSPSVKGQTLFQIYGKFFAGMEEEQKKITQELNDYEKDMPYVPVKGAFEFIAELRKRGVTTAIVTSSNKPKMENVYRHYPEFKELVGHIFTSEFVTRSKPDPQCFLNAMEALGAPVSETVVFEDSINGLKAARASGAYVVGLLTSNPAEVVNPMCDYSIEDFTSFTPEELSKVSGIDF